MFTCPLRWQQPLRDRVVGTDDWQDGECSFCGSLEPRRAMNQIESGIVVTPGDAERAGVGFRTLQFRHLSAIQQTRFEFLAEEGLMTLAGRFVVKPYFFGQCGC